MKVWVISFEDEEIMCLPTKEMAEEALERILHWNYIEHEGNGYIPDNVNWYIEEVTLADSVDNALKRFQNWLFDNDYPPFKLYFM
jgi:hypothetical protein